MPKTKNTKLNKHSIWITVVLVLVAIVVLLSEFKYLRSSIDTIKQADFVLVGWALLFAMASYLAAAGSYVLISYFRLRYWPTVLIQLADGFTNRLLPAGTGAIATSVVYLSRQGRSKVKAGEVVGINNLLGVVGHLALLVVLLLVNSVSGHAAPTIHISDQARILSPIVLIVIIIVLLLFRHIAKNNAGSIKSLAKVPDFVLRHPTRTLAALGCSMAVTSCYGLTLFMSALALNVHLTLLQAFLVLTFGVAAIAITPTPGGLVGAEAAIVTSLVSMSVAAEQALSVVIIYRLLTYLLPLLFGVVALRVAFKRRYLAA